MEQMPKYLSNSCELLTTKCVLKELEKLGSPVFGALHILKSYEILHCPHTPEKSVESCFLYLARKSIKEGKQKLMFATNDSNLKEKLRTIPGISNLFIGYNTIILEDISEASLKKEENISSDLKRLQDLKKQVLGDDKKINHRKRKPKGPNPLSCLKKKPKVDTSGGDSDKTKKTRRKKKIANSTQSK
ncbi:rRNA-processing protein UTP23 homolog [Strongyloides ratti]|uniref:rRNA-processing protein UTP23 homolog n=1 Tax=Strongyloides ratti TaxID=34506 RepID=A0A090L9S1_STRRB|nr:rRNA-processing protein UTP23 homolog [Strongyloides ratti]CEF64220.1 rRNA-processing protein UTP23 homolog [Strongyloides ratti]